MKNLKKHVDPKLIWTLAGVAVVAGSVVAVADYVKRKKSEKVVHAAELILGIAGVAAGTLIATEPRRMANKTALEMDDIFGDDDIELTRRQSRETLNGSVEEEIPAELPLVTEDAVEEEIPAELPLVTEDAVEEEAEAIAADFME